MFDLDIANSSARCMSWSECLWAYLALHFD